MHYLFSICFILYVNIFTLSEFIPRINSSSYPEMYIIIIYGTRPLQQLEKDQRKCLRHVPYKFNIPHLVPYKITLLFNVLYSWIVLQVVNKSSSNSLLISIFLLLNLSVPNYYFVFHLIYPLAVSICSSGPLYVYHFFGYNTIF